ncbi:unnamed protein product [Peronospora belbahrii]|nr:unnamed protein product [Peronospora belbahrii]
MPPICGYVGSHGLVGEGVTGYTKANGVTGYPLYRLCEIRNSLLSIIKMFGGYHAIALPLQYSSFQRFIYVKQHDFKPNANAESILAAGRTAYVVNLPTS